MVSSVGGGTPAPLEPTAAKKPDEVGETALETIGDVGRHKHYSRFYRDGDIFDYIGDRILFSLGKDRLADPSQAFPPPRHALTAEPVGDRSGSCGCGAVAARRGRRPTPW
jgi:hypothetical protein